jgi:Flp pilus assembly pilin Flp
MAMRQHLVPWLSRIEQGPPRVPTIDLLRGGFLSSWWVALTSRALAQDVVEYGLIVATIAIVILMATVAFGNQIEPWFQHLAGRITTTGT